MSVSLSTRSAPFFLESTEEVLAKINLDGLCLAKAPIFIKNNPEFVKIAVAQNGMSLQFASEECKADPEIVFLACSNNPEAFQFASIHLRQDQEYVARLVSHVSPACICHAHAAFTNKDRYAKAFLQVNAAVYPYLSKSLTSLVSFNIEAVQLNTQVFDFLDESYTSSHEFLNLLCFKEGMIFSEMFEFVISKIPQELLAALLANPSLLQDLEGPLEENLALADLVCRFDIRNLEHVSMDLRNNLKFMEYLILNKDPAAFEFASEALKDHDGLALQAVTFSGMQICNASARIKEHSRLHAQRACSVNSAAYLLCHDNFKKDPEIAALAFLGDHFLMEQIPEETFMLPEFWAIVLHTSHAHLMLCPDTCLSSPKFWLELIKIDEDFLSLCPKEFAANTNFKKMLGL